MPENVSVLPRLYNQKHVEMLRWATKLSSKGYKINERSYKDITFRIH